MPNGFARNWIEKYYMESLQRCVEAVLGNVAAPREPERAVPEQGRAEALAARAPRVD